MNEREIKALVSLLDDDDHEVLTHVESQIKILGRQAVPFLEQRLEDSEPPLQRKIEDLINDLQISAVAERLLHWKAGGAMDLLEGLWIVATYQYPDLRLEQLQNEIKKIYFEAWVEYRENLHPTDQVRILNSVIFEKLQFSPNTKNFHATANSMLNRVFETKTGNPISLCVIYLLVARELGLPVFGVNLPNLFILTYKSDLNQFYINVFNRGLIFSRNDINTYLLQLRLDPQEAYFEPCSNLDIVKRFLNNIAFSFEKSDDIAKAKQVHSIIRAIE